MTEISLQETFDTVVGGLRKQGCKSLIGNACKFRGENGTKCAIGQILPDDLYNPLMDNPSDDGIKYNAWDIIITLGHDYNLCVALQNIHDICHVADWELKWKELAKRCNLNYREPNGN
jgi:hypothetical protein